MATDPRSHNGVPSRAGVLGHSNLGTTATYLEGIAPFEVVNAMTARPAPEGAS